MHNVFSYLTEWFTWNGFFAFSQAILLTIMGFVFAKLLSALLAKTLNHRIPQHQLQLARRSVFYITLLLFLVVALQHLGFKLSVLLGATGIATVALGFAAQTSVSNIISGLFLIGDQSFVLGDIMTVNGVTGEVLAIDLLSIKIRTYDNTLVRIPNETLIKTNIINLTRFPMRRFDLALGVAYKENLAKVREVLLQVAADNPLCLQDPPPLVFILGFGSSAINLQFSTWALQQNFVALKNTILEDVKNAFEKHQIEIPFNQLTINMADSKPLPVR